MHAAAAIGAVLLVVGVVIGLPLNTMVRFDCSLNFNNRAFVGVARVSHQPVKQAADRAKHGVAEV